jgi:hypothetical protein
MVQQRIKSVLGGTLAGVVLAISPTALAAPGNGNSNAGNSVTICHATGSTTNPFVRISPNANGVISGHVNHQDTRDIIPPFSYNDHGSTKQFPGQNWDAGGQATFNNNCVPVTGGRGGGTGGQTLGAATTTPSGGRGSGSQVVAPQGSVNAGAGGAVAYDSAAVVGMTGSLLAVLYGAHWLNRRKLV